MENEKRIGESNTLKETLHGLRRRLRAEQQALTDLAAKYDGLSLLAVDSDDAAQEAAALHLRMETIRPKIHGLELLIGEKEKAKVLLDKAIFAEFQRERQETDRAEKFQRWQGLAVECGTARKEMESLTKQLTAAQADVDEQADVIQHRRDDLSDHLAAKPTPANFPTQAELAKWSAGLKALEGVVAEAFAEMRRRSDHRSSIAAEQLQARIRFEQLVPQERLARLPGFDLAVAVR